MTIARINLSMRRLHCGADKLMSTTIRNPMATLPTYRGSHFAQPQPKKRNGNPHKKASRQKLRAPGRGSRRPRALKITRF
jgi:hypothetical protein